MSASLAELRAAVTAGRRHALRQHGAGGGSRRDPVERPKRDGQGDYSTNVAMLLAPALRKPPREIAERVGAALQRRAAARS